MLRVVQQRASRGALRLSGPSRIRNFSSSETGKSSSKPSSTPPGKKNGGGGFGTAFLLTTVTSVGALGYLAYEKENGHPMAEHIAGQPVISDLLEPFTNAIKSLGLGPKDIVVDVRPVPKEVKEVEVAKNPYELPPIQDIDIPESAEIESPPLFDEEEKLPATEELAPAVDTVEARDLDNEQTPFAAEDHEIESSAAVVVGEPLVVDPVIQKDAEEKVPAKIPEVGSEVTMKSSLPVSSASREILHAAGSSAMALRQELETLMLKDIQTMDAPALRLRVVQLASELFERLSWENMRLNHAVRQVEEEMTAKYDNLMAKQRKELEFEIEKIIFEKERALAESSASQQRELEEKYNSQMQTAIKAQAEGFQSTLQKALADQQEALMTDFQTQANLHHANLRNAHNKELLQNQEKVEALNAELKTYHAVLNGLGDAVENTFSTHTISTAILTLESVLSQSTVALKKKASLGLASPSVATYFERVKALSQGDDLVNSVIDTLPARVKTEGALTLSELQIRFGIMRDEARKAALAPEQAPKLVGQVIGTVLANLSFTPSGFINGPGTEETLARAAYYLERGKLKESLDEVKSISGYAKVIASDWITLAEDRLMVDQAVKTLKAESIVRHRNVRG